MRRPVSASSFPRIHRTLDKSETSLCALLFSPIKINMQIRRYYLTIIPRNLHFQIGVPGLKPSIPYLHESTPNNRFPTMILPAPSKISAPFMWTFSSFSPSPPCSTHFPNKVYNKSKPSHWYVYSVNDVVSPTMATRLKNRYFPVSHTHPLIFSFSQQI